MVVSHQPSCRRDKKDHARNVIACMFGLDEKLTCVFRLLYTSEPRFLHTISVRTCDRADATSTSDFYFTIVGEKGEVTAKKTGFARNTNVVIELSSAVDIGPIVLVNASSPGNDGMCFSLVYFRVRLRSGLESFCAWQTRSKQRV